VLPGGVVPARFRWNARPERGVESHLRYCALHLLHRRRRRYPLWTSLHVVQPIVNKIKFQNEIKDIKS
jgi:hypothetical protein